MDLQKEINNLKVKAGYDGKPQQWQFGFDLACRELAKAQAVPGKTVQLHLVWNENKDECVGFLNQGDAHYTATGNDGGAWGVTALGDYFRDINDESDEFETQIVMIEARESAND